MKKKPKYKEPVVQYNNDGTAEATFDLNDPNIMKKVAKLLGLPNPEQYNE